MFSCYGLKGDINPGGQTACDLILISLFLPIVFHISFLNILNFSPVLGCSLKLLEAG